MHRFRASVRYPLTFTLILAAFLLAGSNASAQGSRGIDLPVRREPLEIDRVAPIVPDLTNVPAQVKLDGRLRLLGHSAAGQSLIRGDRGNQVVSVILKGSVASSALRGIGAQVGAEAGEFRTARIPLSALPALVKLPGVESISLGSPLRPQLDVSVPDTRADLKRTDSPPLYGWNGTNVIVGIVDTGMDYQHDDFKNPNGTTRFLSIWDQNSGGVPPPGFGYGNECTQAQINAGTCTEADPNGHGTHVTGIAAGDGSGTGNFEPNFIYVGMANAADIIGVASDFSVAGVLDAVDYIFQKAAALGRPAVVNLSLGTVLGPHDGTTSFEQALDALTGPGKIVVTSAGNTQQDLNHASANIPLSSAVNYNIQVPNYTPLAGTNNDYLAADFWHAGANAYTIRVKRPSSATLIGPVTKGNSLVTNTTDGQIVIDYTNAADPGNGLSEVYVEVNDLGGSAPKNGAWQIQFSSGASEPGDPKVHGWMDYSLGAAGAAATFTSNVDTTVNVGSPGTSDSVLTAAAHTTKKVWASIDGGIYNFIGAVDPPQIAPFSARGPRRDGVQKPDISAPGAAIVSTLSADSSPPWPAALIVPDGVHLVLQGTSMSAPHVTGAVALLLQKYPTLTPNGAKLLLHGTARADATTGAVPNPRWGYGRLDLNQLLCSDLQPPAVTINYPTPGATLYQTTEVGLGWTAVDNVSVSSVKLEYRDGTTGVWTLIADNEPNDGSYNFTVPAIVTDSLQVRVTASDCVGTGAGSSGFHQVRAPTVDTDGSLPLRFAVRRPAPNPFMLTSKVGFDLPSAPQGGWPVAIDVYNVAGRKVRTLVQTSLPAGRYQYEWDGRDDSGLQLSAGIYFLSVKAGSYSQTDRILFLR